MSAEKNGNRDELLLEQARKFELPAPKKWMKPRTTPLAGDEAKELILKLLRMNVSLDPLRSIRKIIHEVKQGIEYFVATDGRRMSVFSRTAPDNVTECAPEFLDEDGKPVPPSEISLPAWRSVVPIVTESVKTSVVDFKRFSFLENIKTAKDDLEGHTKEGWRIGLVGQGLIIFRPEYFADLVKQIKKLNRELGMVTLVGVTSWGSEKQVRFDAIHSVWHFTHILMPLQIRQILMPTDIILNAFDEDPQAVEG